MSIYFNEASHVLSVKIRTTRQQNIAVSISHKYCIKLSNILIMYAET